MQEMDYGLLMEEHFLKMTLFPEEVSTQWHS